MGMQFINYRTSDSENALFFDRTDRPEPGPEEILVEVYAFGLNRADLLQRKGQYLPPPGASGILGLECSGIVRAVGRAVHKWKPGDAVCGLVDGGAYAEYCCVDQSMAWTRPDSLSWEEAAAMPETYLTAFQALFQLMDATRMQRILIHAAASGVGTAAIQLMDDLRLEKWGTASGGKQDYCLKLGYDKIIDYQRESFREKVLEWTMGEGVDGILDFVGGPYFEDNLGSLAIDGKMVILGFLGGVKIQELNILPVVTRRLSIQGSTLRSRSRKYKRQLVKGFLELFEARMAAGRLKPILFQTFDWSAADEAHGMMASNQNMGKIVMSISRDR